MKRNFHIAFKNALGTEAYEMVTVEGNKEKRYQMMDDIICQGLFDGRFLRPTGDEEKDARQKLQAFELYQKIRNANGEEVEITTEEATLIKKMASLLSPGAYGQIYQLIEGGK